MKTVILLIDSLGSGGAQRQIVNLAIVLKKIKYEVLLLYYNPENHFLPVLLKNNIKVKLIERKEKSTLEIIRKVRAEVKNNNAKLIISYLFTPTLIGLIVKALLLNKVKLIVSERSFDKNKSYRISFIRFFYFNTEAIVANSKSQMFYLKLKYPKLSKKIVYIQNGINFKQVPPKQKGFIKQLNIIAVGNIYETKNTKLLIEAINVLNNKMGKNIFVTWYGKDYEILGKTNKYFNDCNVLIEKYKLKTFWKWGGQIKDITTVIRNYDILVHPSKGEGFPNVIIEAMGNGLPVIAASVYDHPYIIKNGFNGFLFESNNINALVKAIDKMIGLDNADYYSFSKNAIQVAQNNFSLYDLMNNYKKLINKILHE